MSSTGVIVGFDLGGGGVRCLVADLGSGDVSRASRSWEFPRAGDQVPFGFELDLPRVWECTGAASRDALEKSGVHPSSVVGVAVSALRFATILVNAAGETVFSVPNRDARAAAQAFRLAGECGEALLQESGLWPLSIHTSSRLLWLRDTAKELLVDGVVQLSLGDWLNFQLCGARATDASQASGAGLFGLLQRSWNWDRIDSLDLPRTLFGPVLQSGDSLGFLDKAAAVHLGLMDGTPVFMGGADTPCALLGAGAIEAGDIGLVAGTTAPLEAVVDEPVVDAEGRLRSGHHVVPSRWVVESSVGTTGEVLSFLARILFPEGSGPEQRLLAEASLGAPGAGGAVSTFGAERMNDRQAGVPLGHLTLSHMTAVGEGDGRRNVARAIAEGVACGVRANMEQLAEVTGQQFPTLQFCGGMSQSDFMAQLLADICDTAVCISRIPESSALGAVICAGVGAEVFGTFEEGVAALATERLRLTPEPQARELSKQVYQHWSDLSDAARPEFARLGANIATPAVISAHATRPVHAHTTHRPRMLVTADLDDRSIERLGQHGHVVHQNFRESMKMLTGERLIESLQGFDVFVTEIDVVDAEVLGRCPELRVVASCRGDAVNVDVRACNAYGIPVLHAPGRNAEAVADLTLAFLLGLARRLPDATRFLENESVTAGDLGKMGQAFMKFRGRELWGAQVGLVGLGAVGRAVARRLAAFGADVRASDPFASPAAAEVLGVELVELPALLRGSDFISLHAAVTDDTRGLVGSAEFSMMRPGSFLINTARAALVDEAALHAALEEGALAGAALDTFAVEPPGFDHPLVRHPRVVTTPHIGGNTHELAIHQGEIIVDGFEAMLARRRHAALANPQVLGDFDWDAGRREPSSAELEALAEEKAPAVSDLQQDDTSPAEPAPTPSNVQAAPALVAAMEKALVNFTEGICRDTALAERATGEAVTIYFVLSDLGLDFTLTVGDGVAEASLGALAQGSMVTLRMDARVLDGMFTGTSDAMQAAMTGELAFSGDAAKGMALQNLQNDLERIYLRAKEDLLESERELLAELVEGPSHGSS